MPSTPLTNHLHTHPPTHIRIIPCRHPRANRQGGKKRGHRRYRQTMTSMQIAEQIQNHVTMVFWMMGLIVHPSIPCGADIYSLGATLVHFLTGKSIHVKQSTWKVHFEQWYRSLGTLHESCLLLADALQMLIFSMLDPDPAKRPTAHQIIVHLRQTDPSMASECGCECGHRTLKYGKVRSAFDCSIDEIHSSCWHPNPRDKTVLQLFEQQTTQPTSTPIGAAMYITPADEMHPAAPQPQPQQLPTLHILSKTMSTTTPPTLTTTDQPCHGSLLTIHNSTSSSSNNSNNNNNSNCGGNNNGSNDGNGSSSSGGSSMIFTRHAAPRFGSVVYCALRALHLPIMVSLCRNHTNVAVFASAMFAMDRVSHLFQTEWVKDPLWYRWSIIVAVWILSTMLERPPTRFEDWQKCMSHHPEHATNEETRDKFIKTWTRLRLFGLQRTLLMASGFAIHSVFLNSELKEQLEWDNVQAFLAIHAFRAFV